MKRLLAISLFLLTAARLDAQWLDSNVYDRPLKEVLQQVEAQYGVKLLYEEKNVRGRSVKSAPWRFYDDAEARTSKPREDGKGGNEIKILLNKNQLTGPIPAAIGDMALLAKPAKSISLDLSYNRLTGEIPASVAQLTELTALIGLQNLSARFNSAMDIPAQGLCRIPEKRS